ncbi:hypothetical protein PHYSODRAFT_523644, partial [Phytophthora sojae]
KGSRAQVGNYRPISLMPVEVKVMSKVIVHRLKPLLKDLQCNGLSLRGQAPVSTSISSAVPVSTQYQSKLASRCVTLLQRRGPVSVQLRSKSLLRARRISACTRLQPGFRVALAASPPGDAPQS